MPTKNHTFPWGIYIGDLIDNNDTIPLCLDSKQGGFCVLFDDTSQAVANNFIENVALKLFEVLPLGSISVDIFDFGKPRFMKLSAFKKENLYTLSYNEEMMNSKFNTLDKLKTDRLYHLLSADAPTLNEYNKINETKEKYYLLLINLEDFSNENDSPKRVKKFFDALYDAGFYTIVFGHQKVKRKKSKVIRAILEEFYPIHINSKIFEISNELFGFPELLVENKFRYVDNSENRVIKSLSKNNFLNSLEKIEADKFDDTLELIEKTLAKSSNKDVHITIHHGDIVKNKTTVYAERIENSFNKIKNSTVNNDLKTLLKLLNQEALKISDKIESKRQEEFIQDVEILTKEALKEKPNKKMFDISVQGVLEALETVGNVGNTFIELLPKVIEFL